MAALVQDADQEEERTRRDAVVDHLEKASRKALGVQSEHAEHDEAQVAHGGIGHELLHVRLHPGRAVQDLPYQEERHQGAAFENKGIAKRRNWFHLRRTPAGSPPAVGLDMRSSQVWNGNIGTLMANARRRRGRATSGPERLGRYPQQVEAVHAGRE
jgi:hypothetical protein